MIIKDGKTISSVAIGSKRIITIKKGTTLIYNSLEYLDETDNSILNYILQVNTPTEIDTTEAKINQMLDEIIGGK